MGEEPRAIGEIMAVELWQHVFSFCDVRTLGRLEAVSRGCCAIIRDEKFPGWKSLCQSEKPKGVKSWREWCIREPRFDASCRRLNQQVLGYFSALRVYRSLARSHTCFSPLVGRLQWAQKALGKSALAWGFSVVASRVYALNTTASTILGSPLLKLTCQLASVPVWTASWMGRAMLSSITSISLVDPGWLVSFGDVAFLASMGMGFCACRYMGHRMNGQRSSSEQGSAFEKACQLLQTYEPNVTKLLDNECALEVISKEVVPHFRDHHRIWLGRPVSTCDIAPNLNCQALFLALGPHVVKLADPFCEDVDSEVREGRISAESGYKRKVGFVNMYGGVKRLQLYRKAQTAAGGREQFVESTINTIFQSLPSPEGSGSQLISDG